MSFREIVGQEIPLSIFENSLKANRIPHAYLFVGEEGIGKRLAAHNLAKVLNCEKGLTDACDRCSSCQKIDRFLHPEVKWLEPDGVSQTIKIEHILKLQHEIYLKPYEGRKKVFILLEAERMNREAANAFLKTLEEPPGESIIILITSSPGRLLPTIKSRCQLVRFSLIPQERIERFLRENSDCSVDEAKSLSLISGGRLGEAVRLKKEGAFRREENILNLILEKEQDVLDTVEDIIEIWDEHKKSLELKYAEDLKLQEENLDKKFKKVLEEQKKAILGREYQKAVDEGLGSIAFFFRDCLVWKITENQKLIVNQGKLSIVKSVAKASSREELEEKIFTLQEIRKAVTRNAHLRLALMVMLLKM